MYWVFGQKLGKTPWEREYPPYISWICWSLCLRICLAVVPNSGCPLLVDDDRGLYFSIHPRRFIIHAGKSTQSIWLMFSMMRWKVPPYSQGFAEIPSCDTVQYHLHLNLFNVSCQAIAYSQLYAEELAEHRFLFDGHWTILGDGLYCVTIDYESEDILGWQARWSVDHRPAMSYKVILCHIYPIAESTKKRTKWSWFVD